MMDGQNETMGADTENKLDNEINIDKGNSSLPQPPETESEINTTPTQSNSQLQQPIVQQPPQEIKKPKSKKLIFILIALILIIVLATGGYMFYKNQILLNHIAQETPTPIPTLPPPTPTPDPTANWVTYSSPKNNFTLKHPRDWKVKEQGYSVKIESPKILESDKITYFSSPISTSIFEITLSPETDVSLEQLMINLSKPLDTRGSVSDIEETQISGKPAIKFTETGIGLDEEPFNTYQIPTDTGTISISLKNYGKDPDEQKTLELILSTLEFTKNNQLGDVATKEECLQNNGVWRKWGSAQLEYCQIPAVDAGKDCTDGSQCSLGKCISDNSEVPGKCQSYKNIFGCFSYIKEGEISQIICID